MLQTASFFLRLILNAVAILNEYEYVEAEFDLSLAIDASITISTEGRSGSYSNNSER